MSPDELEYVGFWPRLGAAVIDCVLWGAITWPLLTAFYGDAYWSGEELVKGPMDYILSWVLPVVVTLLFWTFKQATPGKMAVSAKIVDSRTGTVPTTGQFIGRYFSYFLALLPLGIGIFWVAFDARNQGLHDKLSGTVVVRKKLRQPRSVSFDA